MSMRRWATPLLLCGALIGQAVASEAPHEAVQPARMPRLALVIDDLGQNPARDQRVLELPGPVALAILPDTRHAATLAEQAHRAGKTVLLHMPMAPAGGRFAWHPQLPHDELERRLDAALAAVPHVSGVNNHMGSAMTEQPQAMAWLMGELQRRHLFFLDSRTSPRTVAAANAQRVALASLSRDIFLDNDPSAEAVAERFRAAIALAREQGSVVVIGHPHGSTLALLERELPRLAEQGIEWIGIDQMIATRSNRAMAAHGKGGIYR
ncbi:divergent polysaccharide deacetylase family protein [Pseudomonas lopnurensis]|uniref:divergent polysaccharide deacetylase family protein n=1 Tax=Pseudomonas lopnurensis TaxID=1477517 RepID=UPI0028A5A7BE|nr:divergent polysaccharide deacetylase family protein [Pseudomonas lopnurensis]